MEKKADELGKVEEVVAEERTKTEVKSAIQRLKMGNTMDISQDENQEKAKIFNNLQKTIDILQKKIDKMKMLTKVKADKIKILENKLKDPKKGN